MKLLITICARGGSKGIPGKNIKMINGKPLIYYTLKTAVLFSEMIDGICDIFLSTDSDEIKDVVSKLNLPKIDVSYIRPLKLAGDSVGKLDAIIDVKKYAEQKNNIKYNYVLDMDVTSPLRDVKDLLGAMQQIADNKDALNLFSVSPANRNPYFNMVEEASSGFVSLCKKGHFLTRQSAPKVYDLNASFYIYKDKFFETNQKRVITNQSIVYVVPHLCFDLDHPIDFEFMNYLLENKRLDFDFIV